MIEITLSSIPFIWPEIILVLTFISAMIVEMVFGRKGRVYTGVPTGLVVLLGFILVLPALFMTGNEPRQLFGTMYVIDPLSVFFKVLILATGIVTIVFSLQSDELKKQGNLGEFFCFLAATTVGMMLMTGAGNLLLMYMTIEMVSIPSYILAGFSKKFRRSGEAALKYVIFGGASSGIMLYGISLVYGLTGAFDLPTIQATLAAGVIAHSAGSYAVLIIAIVMITVGFGYKISAVPFHFWTPDVYEGSPVTVTAFLSVASKAAGFAMMIRFFYVVFFDAVLDPGHWASLPYVEWNLLIALLSVLTMTLGNLVAIWQDNLKRMLAYSSIAHAGYMLMGLVVMSDLGIASMLMYFIVYFFMNLGAFYLVMVIADKTGSEDINDYNGLAKRAPLIAVGLSVCLVSLTGLPPLAGFIGKWMLFSAVMQGHFFWLAIIGVLNSAISLYYYARVMRNMYLRDARPGSEGAIRFAPTVTVVAVLFIIPNILFGIYWGPLVTIAQRSVEIFLR